MCAQQLDGCASRSPQPFAHMRLLDTSANARIPLLASDLGSRSDSGRLNSDQQPALISRLAIAWGLVYWRKLRSGCGVPQVRLRSRRFAFQSPSLPHRCQRMPPPCTVPGLDMFPALDAAHPLAPLGRPVIRMGRQAPRDTGENRPSPIRLVPSVRLPSLAQPIEDLLRFGPVARGEIVEDAATLRQSRARPLIQPDPLRLRLGLVYQPGKKISVGRPIFFEREPAELPHARRLDFLPLVVVEGILQPRPTGPDAVPQAVRKRIRGAVP